MNKKSNIEEKKRLLHNLYKRCCIIIDFFIEVRQRKGKYYSSEVELKNYLVECYKKDKDDISNIDRLIRGYREANKDQNEGVRQDLSKEEQEELRQILKKEFEEEEI